MIEIDQFEYKLLY